MIKIKIIIILAIIVICIQTVLSNSTYVNEYENIYNFDNDIKNNLEKYNILPIIFVYFMNMIN